MNEKTRKIIVEFFKLESASGILLMIAMILAMIFANTSLVVFYDVFLTTPVMIKVSDLEIAKPLLLWINDGLMAIFFFLIGLELKRELLEGELSDKKNIILPGIGALGGMIVPALVYLIFNHDDEIASRGWAIPAATDIAFALGVLALLGSRVPVSLKVFLTSLAVFDDVGAILIIALFYTAKISMGALIVVLGCLLVLAFLNWCRVEARSMYIFIGLIMWVATLKSGVHATIAGVVLAMFIPMRSKTEGQKSPLKRLEDDLQSAVSFIILPIFAFSNAGIRFEGMGIEQLTHDVPIGIAAGLFIGKQLGVFGFCWIAIKYNLSQLPRGASWMSLYGIALLCGIGFTMSLFVGSLAFENVDINAVFDERFGILIGSLFSGVLGYLVLNYSLSKQADPLAKAV